MNQDIKEGIEIVHAIPSHEAFVYASWINNFATNSWLAGAIKRRQFFKMHHAVIERILKRPTTVCLVATMKEDQDVAFGFLVAERAQEEAPTVHFCFVKEDFRKMGIGRLLVQALDWDLNKCFYTHSVNDINWCLSKFPGLKFYPYLA